MQIMARTAVRAVQQVLPGRSSDFGFIRRGAFPALVQPVAYAARPPYSVGHVTELHRIPDSPAERLAPSRRLFSVYATAAQPPCIEWRHDVGYPTAMTASSKTRQLPLVEFIPLMALITALDALSIDTVLPALPAMAADLAVTGANDMQLVVTMMFLGFALGQIAGGPMADGLGRKPAIYWGLALYILGSLIGMLATSFPVMLLARILQGAGASIPFVTMNALVRDLYEGAPMARIMSFIGTVFILVPMLGPLAGQGILLIATWRYIFLLYLGLAVPAALWFALRQPETLPPENRSPMSLARIGRTTLEVLRIPSARGYILCGGLLTGAFLGYLNSAQQIFQDTYGVGVHFVLYFSTLAFSIGVALLLNGTLVERIGMRALSYGALAVLTGLAVLFLPVVIASSGVPPLWATMAYLLASFLFVGVLFGNLNALAMEPLGHIAGIGAAVVGFTSTLIGVAAGALVGRAYDGGITPLVTGFAVLNGLALLAMYWGERPRAALAGKN